MAGAVLGVTVFCMVLGSCSVPELVGPGKKLRWAALLVLSAVALVIAYRERRGRVRRPLARVLAVGAFVALVALLSTAWSVDPRLTFGRGASFALLFLAAGALGLAAGARPRLPVRLLEGTVAGSAAAAVAGLVMLAADRADAVQNATVLTPARFRGLGENPDTLAMLYGLVLPVAVWMLLRSRRTSGRVLMIGVVLLLLGSLSASGSRGGLLAGLVGGLALSATLRLPLRQRLALALSVAIAIVGATAGTRLPKPLPYVASSHTNTPGRVLQLPKAGSAVGAPEPRYSGRLQDELYRFFTGRRSLFTSSGRLQTWYEAIRQADSRPLLGFGFGTENHVYVERVYGFNGSYVEDSFIGFYLQLGAVGLLSVVALLVGVCGGAARAVGRAEWQAPPAALAAVVAGGLALMTVQSYVYSVGNVATATFWISAFVVTALAPAPERAAAAVSVRESDALSST